MTEKQNQGDYVIIKPRNTLMDRVRVTGHGDGIDMEAIARAEKALEELSENFDDWLDEEISGLVTARDNAIADDFAGPARDRLFRAAHDLKGQADTFGYPLITTICASLCRLLEASGGEPDILRDLVDQHVDSARLFAKQKIKDKQHPKGAMVTEALLDAVMQFADRTADRDTKS